MIKLPRVAVIDAARTETSAADLEPLQAATNAAAGHVRNLYIVFLGFAAYLAITLGSISDQQLLRGGPVHLPILNIAVPLVAFFFVVPCLFLLLHLNLLLQTSFLFEKLHFLEQGIQTLPDSQQQDNLRLCLSTFIFNQMIVGQIWFFRWMSIWIGWITFAFTPVIVLLIAQVQSLPYHHLLATMLHRCLIVIDMLFLWYLWWPSTRRVVISYQNDARITMRRCRHVGILFCVLIVAFVSLIYRYDPG